MTPERRRLHRAAILAEGLAQLRSLALPLVIAIFAGGGLGTALWLAPLGALAALGGAYLSWTRTFWWVDEGSIRLRTGVFSERVTSVPLDRVQAIDTVRGPAQRLLGAVEVHVQTAGGGARGEIVLKAVAPAVAEELRGLARAAPAAPAAPETAAPTWSLRPRPLLLAALTSGSLGVLLPVVAAGSQVLDDVLGADTAERLVPDTAREVAIAALAVLAVAWLLSILGTIVAFAGFSVRRDGDRLRIARGIVERREASVPIARVAAIRIVESPLREPLGLAQVRLESAGYAKEPATAQALLPLVRRSEIEAILRDLLPEFAAPAGAAPGGPAAGAGPPGGSSGGPPPRALRRYVLPPLVLGALLPAVLVPLVGAPGLLALALPVAAALAGALAFRTACWGLEGRRLILRRRGMQRTTLVADAARLPEVFTHTSVLQRRAGLATLGVAVSSGRRTAVTHVEDATAREVLARLTRLAVSDPRRAGADR